jgi:uncharacterized membrane protein YfcA
VVWALVPWLAVGAAVGAPVSSWLAQMVPHAMLVRVFALFLLANAASTWFRRGRS